MSQSEKRSFEGHRDQCLATFAEIGIPLDRTVSVNGRSYELRSVLEDSVANFFIDQRELEWTSVAYILYLPPNREWVNRFGERFTFDDLAAELISRPSERASCFGSHLFSALNLMLRVDREHHRIISDETAARIHDRLTEVVRVLVQSQLPSGAWTYTWDDALRLTAAASKREASPVAKDESLLATGHLAEMFQYLPVDMQPPREVHTRSAMWLLGALQAATPEEKISGICPCTHAASAVRQLMYAIDPGESGATQGETDSSQ